MRQERAVAGEQDGPKPKIHWLTWAGLGAAVVCLGLGGIVSAILCLIAAFMGCTPFFAANAAQGKPTLGIKGRFAFGGLMAFLAVLALPASDSAPTKGDANEMAADGSVQCDFGAQSTGADYAAKDYVGVLLSPEKGAAPVEQTIGDQKAPLIMEEGETIREHCRNGQWAKVHIPSSNEMPRLVGWVPTSALLKVPTGTEGRRVYNQSDFAWPKGAPRVQPAVATVINKMMDERRECEAVSQRHLVYDKATKTFSIPCYAGAEMISFDFAAADAANGRSFAKVDPLAQADAIAACRSAVRQNATHPSTVEFPWLDYDFKEGQEGRTDLRMSAKAKNAFGLELKFKVWCEFHGADLKTFGMEEDAR